MYIYIHVYIHVYIYIHVYKYIYIYVCRKAPGACIWVYSGPILGQVLGPLLTCGSEPHHNWRPANATGTRPKTFVSLMRRFQP